MKIRDNDGSPNSGALLEVTDLTKRFGGVVAQDRISFSIEPGIVCGLIGPNGAGKTTLFNMITGIYRPDGGQVLFNGTNTRKMAIHKIVSAGIAKNLPACGAVCLHDPSGKCPGGHACQNPVRILGGRHPPALGQAGRNATPGRKPSSFWNLPGCPTGPVNRQETCPSGDRKQRKLPGRWPRTPNCCSWTSQQPASTPLKQKIWDGSSSRSKTGA